MPVVEVYLPDPEVVRRYLCAWMTDIWRRVNANLFLDEEANYQPIGNPFSARNLIFLVAVACFFMVDWLGYIRYLGTRRKTFITQPRSSVVVLRRRWIHWFLSDVPNIVCRYLEYRIFRLPPIADWQRC